jgi:DNA replication and repair protein RecF
MHITNLSIRNFRNFHRLDLVLDPGTTLLYGSNASGKTSLLEALFYLATTRSLRAGYDRELIRWGTEGEAGAAPFAHLKAEVQRTTDTLLLEVIVQFKPPTPDDAAPAPAPAPASAPSSPSPSPASPMGTRKLVRINQKPVRSLDLIGQLRVVLFTPSDLMLVEGAPAGRRRYLDMTLSQMNPRYVRTLSLYTRLVQQRNSLLRSWRDQRRPFRAVDNELEYWDREIAASGSYLLAERLRAVDDLNRLVGAIFQDIDPGTHPLEIRYQSSFEEAVRGHREPAATDGRDAQEMAHSMVRDLRALRRDELNRGQTLIGPHRDDLLFSVEGINLGVYGSRGQQRSVALALKLGEAELMYVRSGDRPVLLLDDVLSELDLQRRAHVLEVINRSHQQTLLTATDLGNFDAAFLQQVRCLRIDGGQVY